MALGDLTRDLSKKQKTAAAIGAGAFILGAATAAAVAVRSGKSEPRSSDDAPGRTARRRWFGDYAVAGRSITINRPRGELYAFWRDFQNLPRIMEDVEAVQPTGTDRADWQIKGPGGRTFHVETQVVEDRPEALIAWRSVEGSEIDTEGRVAFRDAPGDRGTIVEAIVAYKPPAGEAGRLIAKALQHEPEIQARRELRRFKMLMETGEIATAANRRDEA
ncbi:MAG TPA: SRPBCC family protein [Allosphingosinicella sp.]